MNDDAETCDAIAQHPEHGEVRCSLEPGHAADVSHMVEVEGETLEWDYDAAGGGATFDVEAFVKALPEGVALCPTCLGSGGVVEEPPFDPTTHTCTNCSGRGKVRTGSLKSNEAERDCIPCAGRGWVPNDPGELPAGPARAVDLVEPVRTDYAGRTPDDPDYDWTRVMRDVEPIAPAAEPAPA